MNITSQQPGQVLLSTIIPHPTSVRILTKITNDTPGGLLFLNQCILQKISKILVYYNESMYKHRIIEGGGEDKTN